MSTTDIVVASVLLVSVFCTAAIVTVAAFLKQRIPWNSPIPFCGSRSGFIAPSGFDTLRLGNAVVQAAACLAASRRWSAAQISSVVATIHVIVSQTNTWMDPALGSRIAGYALFNVAVGFDLSALCHELAHLCEHEIDHIINDTHRGWDADGTLAAIDAYEAWLKLQYQPTV